MDINPGLGVINLGLGVIPGVILGAILGVILGAISGAILGTLFTVRSTTSIIDILKVNLKVLDTFSTQERTSVNDAQN